MSSMLLSIHRLWKMMASDTVMVMHGKKAMPPNLGIWAVCSLRPSIWSNRRRRNDTSEIRGRAIALKVYPTMTVKMNSMR